MKKHFRCWDCEQDYWSAAKKRQPRCRVCRKELDGPLAPDNCNACGRELMGEAEHTLGLCGVCSAPDNPQGVEGLP